MTNPLNLIKALDAFPVTPRAKPQKIKSRRERRRLERDRIKSAKVNKKNG